MDTSNGSHFIALIRKHSVFSFYLTTFGIAGLGTFIAFGVFHGNLVVQWIAAGSPALVSILLTSLIDRQAGIRDLLASLVRWKVSWRWYLAALALPVLFALAWIFLNELSKGEGAAAGLGSMNIWLQATFRSGPALLMIILMMAVMITGEEIGWRGFALPRLLKSHSPLVASTIVGFFWGIWHLPTALDPTSVLNKAPLPYSITLFTLGTIVFSYVYTWLWMKTGGSLLIICLFHGAYDLLDYFTAALFPEFYVQFWLYLIGLAIIMLPMIAIYKPFSWVTRLEKIDLRL